MAHRRRSLTGSVSSPVRQDRITSADFVAELRRLAPAGSAAKPAERLQPGEEAFGLRMGDLFDLAKAHIDVTLDVVDGLLDHPAYEVRLAAFCILDFKARTRLSDDERRDLYELYLRRHDRITTWAWSTARRHELSAGTSPAVTLRPCTSWPLRLHRFGAAPRSRRHSTS